MSKISKQIAKNVKNINKSRSVKISSRVIVAKIKIRDTIRIPDLNE